MGNTVDRWTVLFPDGVPHGASRLADNLIAFTGQEFGDDQEQTKVAFSRKWSMYDYRESFGNYEASQRNWYLDLYGFASEDVLSKYLRGCSVVLDAGAGKCEKAAWFAELSPETTVVAADVSTSIREAAAHFSSVPNLLFIQCDIAQLDFFPDNFFDYVSCDQVIHHTENPRNTFAELSRVTRTGRDFSCYVYRKKALPRELLDDHFREYSKQLSHEELMGLSEQLTDLGRLLNEIDHPILFPDIPALGIEGGEMTVQRFLYWNFIKCFWNAEMGREISVLTNYDWYSPSQAARYSKDEYLEWVREERHEIVSFHEEQACYSGRFRKTL
jgi:ubiquinone/menaquinone biosynthesis C-methylase UbiE